MLKGIYFLLLLLLAWDAYSLCCLDSLFSSDEDDGDLLDSLLSLFGLGEDDGDKTTTPAPTTTAANTTTAKPAATTAKAR